MAKRRKRKDMKKRIASSNDPDAGDKEVQMAMVESMGADGLFEVKAKKIEDTEFKEQLMYHMRTDRCPYNRLECIPTNCPFGLDGMKRCPIHEGTVM